MLSAILQPLIFSMLRLPARVFIHTDAYAPRRRRHAMPPLPSRDDALMLMPCPIRCRDFRHAATLR